MMNTPTFNLPSFEESSLQDCEAVLVCLNTKRFVIVRYDEPKDFWPVDGGWEKLRDLKPGDEVIYKGDRTTIRAIDVYC